MKSFVLIYCFIIAAGTLPAQKFLLQWSGIGQLPGNTSRKFTSPESARPYIDKEIRLMHSNGYLEASCDSVIIYDSTRIKAFIHTGPLYRFTRIDTRNIPREIMHASGCRYPQRKTASLEEWKKNNERLISWCENHGYPFASLTPDSVIITPGEIACRMTLDKGRFYKIDSVIIKGTGRLPVTYIRNYIHLKPGDIYCENTLREIDQRLREIPFLVQIKPTEVVFTPTQCMVYIYMKRKNASQFNGVLGFLPDAATGKLLVTGDARIALRNALNGGEWIEANWRRLGTQTQDLKIMLKIPYLFKSPIGTGGSLKLYKRDTSYIEVTRHAEATYHFSDNHSVRVLYHHYTSDVISLNGMVNTANVLRYSDVTTRAYGVGFTMGKTDRSYNPRSGFIIDLQALAGHKNIRSNEGINDSLYVGLRTRTENYQAQLTADGFIPLFRQSAVHIGNQTKFMINPVIFQNETMRLGGIRTLRGFDEESIFATAYSVFTLEYRFLFEDASFAYLFFDQAWYEKNLNASFATDTPYGFGVGISFGVKAGIFTLNYALGSQFNNPIQLRGSKVHFGFISYF